MPLFVKKCHCANVNSTFNFGLYTLVSQITDSLCLFILRIFFQACISYSGLLSFTKRSHVRLFILGILYPAEPLIGTVGYSGH